MQRLLGDCFLVSMLVMASACGARTLSVQEYGQLILTSSPVSTRKLSLIVFLNVLVVAVAAFFFCCELDEGISSASDQGNMYLSLF